MPTRPHSAPVKKNGNTINCVTLSIGVTQQNNFAQANIRRSHGGVRGAFLKILYQNVFNAANFCDNLLLQKKLVCCVKRATME